MSWSRLASSLISSAVGFGAEKGVETLINKSISSAVRNGVQKGTAMVINKLISSAVGNGAQKGIETLINKSREREKEKTRKLLECKIDEAFQELKGKMKALQEYLKKLQECRQKEHQLLRADLEMNQGKEGNFARVLLSRMEKEIHIHSQIIQTLQKDIQEWPGTTKYELELLRADLEMNQGKEEEEISRALVSRMTLKFQQLFQRIENLEEDLEELLKSSQHEFQLLRAGQK